MTTELAHAALDGLVTGGARPGQIDRGTRRVRWIEAGAGGPTVVLGAGAGEPGSLAWAAVMPTVAESTRVVAYDRQGLGASDPTDRLSLESALADLAAVVAAVSAGPCVLAGHSWGGLLALLTAMRAPQTVCGLVLVDPADEGYWQSLPADAFAEEQEFAAGLIEQCAQGELEMTIRSEVRPFAVEVTSDPVLQSLLIDAYASCYATTTQASVMLAESRMAQESIPLISAIRSGFRLPDIPIVVMSATEGRAADQRAIWTKAHADLVAQAADGTHIVVQGAGHAIHQERPAEVIAAIQSVLERCRTTARTAQT